MSLKGFSPTPPTTLAAYRCPACGDFDSVLREDTIQCRCGRQAKRVFRVRFDRTSLRQSGRWDPVVGEYVSGHGDFMSKLRRSQEEQSEKLNMDVVLETVDSRDTQALDELHGYDPAERQAITEQTEKAKRDKAQL